MTTKRIIYTRPDGGVSIVCPAPKYVASFENEAEAFDAVQAKDIPPDATDVAVVQVTAIPSTRTFRDAWENFGGAVSVNMPKARIIHMDRIRVVRDKELAKLDAPYLKADEMGDQAEKARIAILKQALRDLPQTFDLSVYKKPDTLDAAWPAELPAK